MGDFAETAWGDRLRDPQREGARLEFVPDDGGAGYLYVAGRFLATDAAATFLGLDAQPGVYLRIPSAVLDALRLREFAYVGQPQDLAALVAALRAQARSGAPAGADLDDWDVALHYVFTGNGGWVPTGHPFGTPTPQNVPASDRTWPAADPLVAVVDTGLDLESATGQAYANGASKLLISKDRDSDACHVPGQLGTELAAQAGHGTFITWIVGHQSGDRVGVVNVRALDADGVGTERQVLDALDRLLRAYPDIPVINLSLGGYTDSEEHPGQPRHRPPLGISAWLKQFTRDHPGSLVVCAAGNYGRDRPFWPAAHPDVIGVAALTGDLVHASFSNHGSWVDVCTFGDQVVGDHPKGVVIDQQGGAETFTGDAAAWSGTSFAAPIVAAEVARRIDESANALTARDAWNALAGSLSTYTMTQHALGLVWNPLEAVPPHNPFAV